jgi:hypothetical protein
MPDRPTTIRGIGIDVENLAVDDNCRHVEVARDVGRNNDAPKQHRKQ